MFARLVLLIALVAPAVTARELPDFTQLIENNSAAVVKINTVTKMDGAQFQVPPGQQLPDLFRHFFDPEQIPERDAHAMGSGFFISSDGYILTNFHVVDQADEIFVRLTDRREYKAEVVGRDRRSDLALLKVDDKGFKYLEFGNSEALKIGEWVVAIGSPFGLDFSASAGIVSAMGRSIPTESQENYVPFIQTDVAINPGNSGGPLFNMDGHVVGVNSQIYTRSGGSIGLSFAIPASVAQDVVNQLKAKGRVDRGWLGVEIVEVDRDLAQAFGLKRPRGALIQRVREGTPAQEAGLREGDIIVEFGGHEIDSSGDLPHVVGATPPGKKVDVVIYREKRKRTLSVEVGALPPAESDMDTPAQIQTDEKVGGRLGIQVGELDDTLKQSWSLDGGVVVQKVDPDGPAAKAGVSPGDVIVQLGFEQIKSLEDYKRIVKDLPADSLLPIRFFTEGRPVFRTITLGK